MSAPEKMVPAEIEALALAYKRLGVAFGDRFFALLFVGMVWLVPAFVDLRFVYALIAWDVLVVLAWVADLAQLPSPSQLTVRRSWHSPAALATPSDPDLTLINASRKRLRATAVD